jgi:hypothetical protein
LMRSTASPASTTAAAGRQRKQRMLGMQLPDGLVHLSR